MTGFELFTKALDLCGLNNEFQELTEDTKDLQARALTLLNIVLAECSVLDCRIRRVEHKVLSLKSLYLPLECSEIVMNSVLPYGLARLLVLGEDDNLASDFNRLYLSAQESALTFGKAKTEQIREVYN